MNRETQKRFAHLPAIKGGVVTSVRELNGEIVYSYRLPARVLERHRKAMKRHKPKEDKDDIGQGEGCEGGKCEIKRGRK
jgi:hypothetical protein